MTSLNTRDEHHVNKTMNILILVFFFLVPPGLRPVATTTPTTTPVMASAHSFLYDQSFFYESSKCKATKAPYGFEYLFFRSLFTAGRTYVRLNNERTEKNETELRFCGFAFSLCLPFVAAHLLHAPHSLKWAPPQCIEGHYPKRGECPAKAAVHSFASTVSIFTNQLRPPCGCVSDKLRRTALDARSSSSLPSVGRGWNL